MALLLMTAGFIISTVSLWLVRGRIQAEIDLPSHRVGKNTDIPVDIRVLHPMRFVGFAIDITYRRENLFTGSREERKEKLWAVPGKGGSLKVLLNSRYVGQLRVSVEECKVYDLLHIFYLTYREEKASEVLAWPAFSEGEDREELCACIEGFPEENECRKRGVEYNPDYEIREYQDGDELKSIHWKLSAKQDKTMVRERLSAGREKINVVLPLGENADENDALIESLYGMCRLLLFKGYPIQLFWQGVGHGLFSRYIMEPGEFENALGEILSTNGIHASGSIEEQMSIEHPMESYILVKTGDYKGVYVSCQQGTGRQRGGHFDSPDMIAEKSKGADRGRRVAAGFLSLFRHRREKENTSDVSLVKMPDHDKYDVFAVLAETLVLFLVIYGAVGGFLAAFDIAFHSGLCIFALFALAFVLSAVYETGKRWLTNLTSLLAFLLYFYIAVTNYWTINNGYYYIGNRIFEVARDYFNLSGGVEYALTVDDGYMAVTLFAIFLGMVGIILLNIQMHGKCSLFRVMVLTLTPYVIPMYFECSLPLRYIILMLGGYAAVMLLSYGRGRISVQMRYILAVTAAAVLCLRAAAFIIPEESYTRVVPQSRAKEESGKRMEHLARYGMLALFPQNTAGSGVSGGKLSKGAAVIPSYETALTVRYAPYSFDPVYLKAFTGLDYIGTAWTEAEPGWPGDGNMESSLRSRYDAFGEEGGTGQGCGIMEVEKSEAEDAFEYRPYYTDYHNIERKDGAFVYHYYPDNGESALLSGERPYERYLDVPATCEAAVRQICEEAGFSGTEQEIARQIVNYFGANYDYTLRPGFYYGSPDYISHFLLESRKGYCAHFASAAAMLFRQMGIPARYVEGYAFSYADVVENGELVEGADYDDYYKGFSEIGATALVQVEIPGAYAHAWVEIFDRERGWIVVDPTPSSAEGETASFWEVFMRREGGETERALEEDILGEYIENVLGVVNYVAAAAVMIAAILLIAARMAQKARERRLSGRERVKLEYGRLQKAAAKKDRDFGTQRTLKEQIAWMREHCHVEISDEQEEALCQAFFAKDIYYDCDKLCGELRDSLRKSGGRRIPTVVFFGGLL
ncbi:MAG: DUF58 domain-containing protein [Lachnospiraceae bacterium]|nr:DUF58 domain-containing protein [Lachnospiraceae bacterium]